MDTKTLQPKPYTFTDLQPCSQERCGSPPPLLETLGQALGEAQTWGQALGGVPSHLLCVSIPNLLATRRVL